MKQMRWAWACGLLVLALTGSAVAQGVPRAPSDVMVISVSTSVADIVWVDNSLDEVGFKIERSVADVGGWVQLAMVGTNVNRYQDTTIVPGTTFVYRIRAYSQAGDSVYSAEARLAAPRPPPPPGRLGATAGSMRILLAWDDTPNETGYRLERKVGVGSGVWMTVAKVGKDITEFTDVGVQKAVRYSYRVLAFNLDGDSPYSNETNAVPLSPPVAPSGLQLQVNGRVVRLQWQDRSGDETGFQIERKVNAGGTWAPLGVAGPNGISFLDGGLGVGAFYYYRVAAYNSDGLSLFSNEVGAPTLPAPANLRATAVSTSRVDLAWQDLALHETGYVVERSTDATNFVVAGRTGPNAAGFVDESLLSGTLFHYRVKTVTTNYGIVAETMSLESPSALTKSIPVAPSGLTATEINAGSSILLRWRDLSDNETTFILEGSNEGDVYYPVRLLSANSVVESVWQDEPDNWYAMYRVAASNEWGASGYSGVAMKTTLSSVPKADFVADVTRGYKPLTVHFADMSTGTVSEWSWVFNAGSGNEQTSVLPVPDPVIYNAVGQYSVKLTVTGPDGSSVVTRTNYIEVLEPPPPPSADFVALVGGVAESTVVRGLSPLVVSFTNRSSGAVLWKTEWDFDGDGVVDAVDPAYPIEYTYVNPGSYSPRIRVYGHELWYNGPRTNSIAQRVDYVVVTAQPPVAVFAAVDIVSGELPLTVTFNDQSYGSITGKVWDFDYGRPGGELTDPLNPISYTYEATGKYSVALTVLGPTGTRTIVRTNLVTVVPVLPNHPPVVVVGEQQIFLKSMADRAVLDASQSWDPDGDGLFYSWREDPMNPARGLIPIGSDSLAKVPLYFPEPGRYRFDVRVADGLEASRELRSVTVYVPGLRGVVAVENSEGTLRVPDVKVVAYGSWLDALNGTNPVDVAVTDSKGQYVLENLSPASLVAGQDYYIALARANFTGALPIVAVPVDPDPLFSATNFFMSRGLLSVPLAGQVLNESGVPVGGARVSVIAGVSSNPLFAVTGPDGRFSVRGVPKGTWTLEFTAAGYRSEARDFQVGDGITNLVVNLKGAGALAALEGRVTLSRTDRPIIGAKVWLSTAFQAQTDSRGRFLFAGIPEGRYTLAVLKDGYEPLRMPNVGVNAGTNRVEVALFLGGSGPTVQGTVVDALSGAPVYQAKVGVETAHGLLLRSDLTDRSGFFQLNDVPVGEQVVRVEANGYRAVVSTKSVGSFLNLDVGLMRAVNWRAPQKPAPGAPAAIVAEPFVFLSNLLASATLDGSRSTGVGLSYLWRELPGNPILGLLPAGVSALSSVQLSGFAKPGIYMFELQVKDAAGVLSPNVAAVTVFAPGLAGNVHSSPSDGVHGLVGAAVRAYPDFVSALGWATNALVSKQSLTDPPGDFALDSLSTGACWFVARADVGHEPYGPVLRRVNFSSAAGRAAVNLKRNEFRLEGWVRSVAGTNVAIENVRVVVDPGVLSESFRTTTGSDGHFVLESVPAGSQPVMLMRDGYETQTATLSITGNLSRVFLLAPNTSSVPARLRGRITARYQSLEYPIPQAEVILGGGLARTFTDDSGRYEFGDLPVGLYVGLVRKEGYRPAKLTSSGVLQLVAGTNVADQDIVFMHGKGPAVHGTIVNSQNQPVAGVKVVPGNSVDMLFSKQGRRIAKRNDTESFADGIVAQPFVGRSLLDSGDTNLVVESDGGGVFQLSGVPDGERQLEIQLSDGSRFSQILNISGSEVETLIVVPSEMDFQVWAGQYTNSPGLANELPSVAQTNDYDRDGFTDWEEYIANTDPTSAGSAFETQAARGLPTGLAFTVATTHLSRRYDIIWQTNLLATNWYHYGYEVWGTGSNLTLNVTNLLDRNNCFYRLKVWRQGE